MSIEAIQQISQAESAAHERELAASARAKQLLRDAQLAGQQLLEQSRQSAGEANLAAMTTAEQSAARRAEVILAANAQLCDALCVAAEARLDSAAALIIKRIVNS